MEKTKSNILDLGRIREKRNTLFVQILKDTRRVVEAIASRTCLICNRKKACVTKTGVCADCFENKLSDKEKMVAESEAQHKIIKLQVMDDRWNK